MPRYHRSMKLALLCGVLAILPPVLAQPAPSTPAAQPSSSTSILDAYKKLWPKVRIGDHTLVLYMYPDRTKLDLDATAPPNAKAKLVAYLESMQPHIKALIELSKKDPEPFPPDPVLDPAKPDAHMAHPRAWFQNFARLLHADAVRQWEAGDAQAAADRLAAIFRMGTSMQTQKSDMTQNAGLGTLGSSIRQTIKLVDAGLMTKLKPEAAAAFRASVEAIKPVKRTAGAPDLVDMVEKQLKTLRTKVGA